MNTKQKHIGKCQNMVYMRRLRKSYEDQIETRWPCSATLSDMIATVDAHPLLFLGQEANVQNYFLFFSELILFGPSNGKVFGSQT